MEKNLFLVLKKYPNTKKLINSDILMVLDECPKLTNDKKILEKAIDVSNELG